MAGHYAGLRSTVMPLYTWEPANQTDQQITKSQTIRAEASYKKKHMDYVGFYAILYIKTNRKSWHLCVTSHIWIKRTDQTESSLQEKETSMSHLSFRLKLFCSSRAWTKHVRNVWSRINEEKAWHLSSISDFTASWSEHIRTNTSFYSEYKKHNFQYLIKIRVVKTAIRLFSTSCLIP